MPYVIEDTPNPYIGKANFKDMTSEYMDSFTEMAQEYQAIIGEPLRVNDAFRSHKAQVEAKRNKPTLAATPGRSLHEKGQAMDIDESQANQLHSLGLLDEFGFHRPVSGENWHIELSPMADLEKRMNIQAATVPTKGKYVIEDSLPSAPAMQGKYQIHDALPSPTEITPETVMAGAPEAALVKTKDIPYRPLPLAEIGGAAKEMIFGGPKSVMMTDEQYATLNKQYPIFKGEAIRGEKPSPKLIEPGKKERLYAEPKSWGDKIISSLSDPGLMLGFGGETAPPGEPQAEPAKRFAPERVPTIKGEPLTWTQVAQKNIAVFNKSTLDGLVGFAKVAEELLALPRMATEGELRPSRTLSRAAKKIREMGAPEEQMPYPEEWLATLPGQVLGGLAPYAALGGILPGGATILGKFLHNLATFSTVDAVRGYGEGEEEGAKKGLYHSVPAAVAFTLAGALPGRPLQALGTGGAFVSGGVMAGERDPRKLTADFLTGMGLHWLGTRGEAKREKFEKYVEDWKKKNGVTDKEFEQVKETLSQPVEPEVSKAEPAPLPTPEPLLKPPEPTIAAREGEVGVTVSPELQRLHDSPVRAKGLFNAREVEVKRYFEDMRKLASRYDKTLIPEIDKAEDAYYGKDYKAEMESERLVGKLHEYEAASEIKEGRDDVVQIVEGIHDELTSLAKPPTPSAPPRPAEAPAKDVGYMEWRPARDFKELRNKYPGMKFETPPYKTTLGEPRIYTVYINKAYFPKDLWSKGEGAIGDLYEATKIKARSRTDAAILAWDKMGRKWLNEMSLIETTQRKISLNVDEPSAASYDRGKKYMGGGAATRLAPIDVLRISAEAPAQAGAKEAFEVFAPPKRSVTYNLEKAAELSDVRTVIRALGGFSSKSRIIKEVTSPEERRMLIGLTKNPDKYPEVVGADVFLADAKARYPHLFPYESDGEFIRAIVDKTIYKKIDYAKLAEEQETHYAEIESKAAAEGIDKAALARIEADVERELAAERDAIQREGSAGPAPREEDYFAPEFQKPALELTPEQIKKTYPDISDTQATILARDPELRAQFAKGNWEALLRQKAQGMVSDVGAQKPLEGVRTGDLFEEPTLPKGQYGDRTGANKIATTYTMPDGTIFRNYPERKVGGVVVPGGWRTDKGEHARPAVGSLKPTAEEAAKAVYSITDREIFATIKKLGVRNLDIPSSKLKVAEELTRGKNLTIAQGENAINSAIERGIISPKGKPIIKAVEPTSTTKMYGGGPDTTEPIKAVVDDTANIIRGAPSKIKDAYVSIKETGANLWEWYKSPFDIKERGFKNILGKYLGARQIAGFENRKFLDKIQTAIPSKVTREGITNWIQAGGDEGILRERAGKSKGTLKKGYEAALRLTPEEKAVAAEISTRFDQYLKEAQEAGILEAGLENYVNQLWTKDAHNKTELRKLRSEINAGLLNTNFNYAKKRIFDSYFTGEQAGYIPKNKDIGFLLGNYHQSMYEAIAARRAIKGMLDGKADDGLPLVSVSGKGKSIPSAEAPEAHLIRPKAIYTESVDGRRYMPIDHPALRKWKWVDKDAEGKPIFLLGDMYVHPDIYKHLNNVLKKSAIREHPVGRATLGVSQNLKGVLLSGLPTPFHQVHLATHAVFHWINPFTCPEINFKDPKQRKLVENGLMVYSHNALAEFAEGLQPTGLAQKIPGIGRVTQAYGEYLFQDLIPRFKMKLGLVAYERNVKRYGNKYTEDQLHEISANQSNAAFGELNYKAMGRNPTMQDAFRLLALAPDFLEARLRFAGQALRPGGREQGIALLRAIIGMYGAGVIGSMLFSDDHKPHWDKPFTVVVGGTAYSLRSVPGDIGHLISDWRSFVYHRLNPTTAKPLLEALSKRDVFGRKRDMRDQIGDYFKGVVPIPLQGLVSQGERTLLQGVFQSFGLSSYKYRTPAEKEIIEGTVRIDYDPETARVQKAISKDKRGVLKLLEEGKTDEGLEKLRDMTKEKKLNPKKVGQWLDKHIDQDIYEETGEMKVIPQQVLGFKGLSLDWAIKAFEKADSKEKGMFEPYLWKKIDKLYKDENYEEYEKHKVKLHKLYPDFPWGEYFATDEVYEFLGKTRPRGEARP